MLDLYGIDNPDERARMADLARVGQLKPWWAPCADLLPAGTSQYLSLESAATWLRSYSSQLIPDLAQTRPYAIAAAKATRPGLSADDAATIAAVVTRRRDFLDDGIQVRLIIDHEALRRPIAPASVMAAQLRHLIAATAIPWLSIRVTAPSTAPAVLSPSFSLLSFAGRDQPAACYHGPAGRLVTTRRAADVQAMSRIFSAFAEAALSPADTAALIKTIAAA
jgi:Domain of unknown function (DUF5753)